MAAAMKLVQESNTSSEALIDMHTAGSEHLQGSSGDVQSALLARSSRSASHGRANASVEDLYLDESLSGKFLGGFVDAFQSTFDALQDAGTTVAFEFHSETIGSAVANVAVVVGNRVVEPPKLKWNDLGGSLRDFAEDIGQDAMSVGEITLGTTTEVAEIAVTQAVTLAKTTLEHAKKTAEQGAKIAEAVGRFIADQARAFGEEVAKVGPLVAGLGQELWSEMMSFLNCVKPSTSLCQVLIGRECDCSAGSYVKVFTDRMEMRCVFSRTSEFSQGFGIKAMQAMQKKRPEGLCETELKVAVDGVTQWSPDIKATVKDNGDTLILGLRVMINLQMVFLLVGKGVLTGTIEMSNDVDFQISASVNVKKNGESSEAVKIGASAEAMLRFSAGPELIVWPMPGIPVTFSPKFHAEAKAKGTIEHQHPVEGKSAFVEAVSLYIDFTITGFAIPEWLQDLLKDDFLKDMIKDAIRDGGAKAMIKMMSGPMQCLPGASALTDRIMDAALSAGNALADLIPGLGLKWDYLPLELLRPRKLWCKEVLTYPEGSAFEEVPCAAELGCQAAGQDPPDESEVEVVPPEQVATPSVSRPSGAPNPSCPNDGSGLKMGKGFIQLGKFRIAEIGCCHLSISHEDTHKVAAVWHKDGGAWRTHMSDWGKYDAWGSERTTGHPGKTIKFGFEFIQIGNFRLGAVDDRHFSISHVTTKKTSMVLRANDGHQMWGSRSDYGTVDRSEGPPVGIRFGD
ncbi:unnamed protein product, partial [Symbiodinium microadriaticum]